MAREGAYQGETHGREGDPHAPTLAPPGFSLGPPMLEQHHQCPATCIHNNTPSIVGALKRVYTMHSVL